MPGTREEFWQSKFDDNVVRDERNIKVLTDDGWRVAVVWECSLKGSSVEQTLADLSAWLKSDDQYFEAGDV